jgi:hypothetical protein
MSYLKIQYQMIINLTSYQKIKEHNDILLIIDLITRSTLDNPTFIFFAKAEDQNQCNHKQHHNQEKDQKEGNHDQHHMIDQRTKTKVITINIIG